MNGTCIVCGAPAAVEISAKVSPSWGTTCEPIQIFACKAHFDALWAQINQDYTAAQPRVVAQHRRKMRVVVDHL